MKVAFLTPEYPHLKTNKSGGIGTSIKSLSKGLIQLGHEVIVIIYGQDKDESFLEGSITFHKIKNVKLKGFSRYLTQKKIENFLNQLHQNNEIDIVEAPDWTGITSYIKPTCPIVIKLHGSDTYFCHIEGRKVKHRNRYHEKRALKQANGVIAVSAYTGKLSNQLFELNKDYCVIPNTIDIASFIPEEIKSKDQILYFGTLIRKKGVLEIPSIFNSINERNPDVEFVLVGKDASDIFTGSLSTWKLMEPMFTEKAKEKVKYLGVVNHDEIRRIINASTVCIFPSFAEAFPVSWLEAMAMERPIVASNKGWAHEMIIDEKEGYLVDPKNHEEYANRVIEILQNEELRRDLGRSARAKILETFTIEKVAQQTINYYTKLLQ